MRKTIPTIAAFCLILLIAANMMAAAKASGEGTIPWGCEDFITALASQVGKDVNHDIIDCIVPIGKAFESDTLKVTILDAAFDGRFIVMSWMVENKSAENAFILCCQPLFNGNALLPISSENESDVLLHPGSTVYSAYSASLLEIDDSVQDLCQVDLRIVIL